MNMDPAMMANMQKMMSDNPDMMKNAMEMMQKNPQMMQQAQQQMQSNPDMMKNAMNMMNDPSAMKQAGEQLKTINQSTPNAVVVKAPEGTAAEQAEKMKLNGNKLYKEGKYVDAVECYQGALDRLPLVPTEDVGPPTRKLQLDLHNNLAAVHLKLKDYELAVRECTSALCTDRKNFKALLRRGQAYTALDLNHSAISDLEQALELTPEDALTKSTIKSANKKAEANPQAKEDEAVSVKRAADTKSAGNTTFKERKYENAIKKYEQALTELYTVPLEAKEAEWSPEASTLLDACHLNCAACNINLSQWKKAVRHCSTVLHRGPNLKAFLRRGQAYQAMNQPYLSLYDLQRASSMNPEDSTVVKTLQEARAAVAKMEAGATAPPSAGPGMTPNDIDPEKMKAMGEQLANMPEEQIDGMTKMFANMDDDQLEAMRAMNPMMKNLSADQMKQMKEKMKNLSKDDVKRAAEAAKSGGMARPSSGPVKISEVNDDDDDEAPPPLVAEPAPSANAVINNPAAMANNPMAAMMKNPEMMKASMDMMKNMDPAMLQQMQGQMASMGGGAGGMPDLSKMNPDMMKASMDMLANMDPSTLSSMTDMMGSMNPELTGKSNEEMKAAASMMKNIDPDQLKAMQDQMKNMKPEDMEKMMKYAQRAQKVMGPCMKVCGPVARVMMPCLRNTAPMVKKLNAMLGGQLPSLSMVFAGVFLYWCFIA